MTPAQQKYDLGLAAAMLNMAHWIEPRSRKVADTLKRGAERIRALVSELPVDPKQPTDTNDIQPASTPARGKHSRAR